MEPEHLIIEIDQNQTRRIAKMCIMKTYETRGRNVVEPPPRVGNYTSHPPAGVMRLPREWRRSESYSDDGRYVEYRLVSIPHPLESQGVRRMLECNYSREILVLMQCRRSQPRAIGYIEEPRRSTTRARSVSRRRVSCWKSNDLRAWYGRRLMDVDNLCT